MRQLFGTDGIRGIAGQPPLDKATVYSTGVALAASLQSLHNPVRVLIGMDTRESGPWIASTIAAGLRARGAQVEFAGVITTPGIAYLTRLHDFSAGVVISASHNPWQDNGIKIFGTDGYKLPDEVELAIEKEIFSHRDGAGTGGDDDTTLLKEQPEYRHEYVRFLQSAVPALDLRGVSLVLDCANGAASAVAGELFAGYGGKVTLTHAAPDGHNINEHCGALHPEVVASEVVAQGADIGVTLDGDADRALFADANGHVINGDAVMLVAARDMKEAGTLTGDTLVATTMSNMGLEAALKRSGLRMLRAPVGDKYVLEEMRRSNAQLGGEQSGHILFAGRSTTGDGLLTALVLLDIVSRSGKSLDELTSDLKVYPQVIVNVRVREKKPLNDIPAVTQTISTAERELADSGRVVVRYSGTEKLARVMIEAESEEAMRRHAEAIASAIRSELGA
jgi:phosphoglucosamine mutase